MDEYTVSGNLASKHETSRNGHTEVQMHFGT
jgi:hypothetical protein